MEEEIQGLSDRIERLLAGTQRLSGEVQKLRLELAESRKSNAELQQRMTDARVKVEAALSRLPLMITDET